MTRQCVSIIAVGLICGPCELSAQPSSSRIYGTARKRPRKRPADARKKPRKKPADARKKPADAPKKPADAPKKPADAPKKPADARKKPADARKKPADARKKPADARKKPADARKKPARPEPRRRMMPWGRPRTTTTPARRTTGPTRPTEPARPGRAGPSARRYVQADPSKAPGIGYTIVGVRVIGNKKTAKGTVLVHARVPIGKPFTLKVRDQIRRRLLSAPFCKSVSINWEVAQDKPSSVVLFLTITEKITWLISPSFSYSEGSYGGSAMFKEKNLLGTGKELRIYSGYNNETQRLTFKYSDPNILFTPLLWGIDLDYTRSNLKEFDPTPQGIRDGTLLRYQTFQQFSTGIELGYRWYNWVTTVIRYEFGLVDFADPHCLRASPGEVLGYQRCLPNADLDPSLLGSSHYYGPLAVVDNGGWTDSIDYKGRFWKWRRDAAVVLRAAVSRTHNVYGMRSGFQIDGQLRIAAKNLGGSFNYVTWAIKYFHGFNFGKSSDFGARHNLTFLAYQAATHDAPYYRELRAGGLDLRGYISQQFVGDTLTRMRVQYKVHMFKLGWLLFRAVAFYDTAWIFFRDGGRDEGWMRETGDLRRYYLPGTAGPKSRNLWNNGIGTGIRLLIKPLAFGSIGFDVAYGLEAKAVRFYLMFGT